jgi:hypothetical protein
VAVAGRLVRLRNPGLARRGVRLIRRLDDGLRHADRPVDQPRLAPRRGSRPDDIALLALGDCPRVVPRLNPRVRPVEQVAEDLRLVVDDEAEQREEAREADVLVGAGG